MPAKKAKHYIKDWRKYRHLTQEQVSERIDMSRPNYNRIENGKVPYTEESLEAIARALSCSPVDLISRHPVNKSEIDQLIDAFRLLPKSRIKQAVFVLRALLKPEDDSDDKAA